MVENEIRTLVAELLEMDRREEEEQREAAERGRRAAERRTRIAVLLKIARQIETDLGISDYETDGTMLSPGGGGVDIPGDARPVVKRGDTIRQILGADFEYLEPDGEPDRPRYEVSVVSGKRNTRERAFAAAQVYGERLKEMSLAHAIFLTGETNAADAASVRGSLAGLVKHGEDWRRERGWLIYRGPGLKPDWETILRLVGERDELGRQVSKEEYLSNVESL